MVILAITESRSSNVIDPGIAKCGDCVLGDAIDLGPCARIIAASIDSFEDRLSTAFSESRLYECRRCSLRFRHPRPTNAQLEKLYASLKKERWNYDPSKVSSWAIGREYLLNRFEDEVVRVLDIGAFDGRFLETLPSTWKRSALEPSAEAQEILVSKGFSCAGDFLETVSCDVKNTFDAITIFDVFEHLQCPRTSLEQAAALLKPGGVLLISTGNSDHWSWRLLKGDHSYLNTIQHLSFGNPRYFRFLADRIGFRFVACKYHPHQQGDFGVRLGQSLETLHFSFRRRQAFGRKLSGLIQLLPKLRHLRHRLRAPHTPSLYDHILVILEKRPA